MEYSKVLSTYISHVSCEGWSPGSSIMLTFGVDGSPPKRTAFITITGNETIVGSRLEFGASDAPSTLQVAAHAILGDNRSRTLAKGTLNLQGVLFPLMSVGKDVTEVVKLKGVKGNADAQVEVRLQLREAAGAPPEDEDAAAASAAAARLAAAMRRQEERARLRARAEAAFRVYESRRRGKERRLALDLLCGFNFSQDLASGAHLLAARLVPRAPGGGGGGGAAGAAGAAVAAEGDVTRGVGGTRHPRWGVRLATEALSEVVLSVDAHIHTPLQPPPGGQASASAAAVGGGLDGLRRKMVTAGMLSLRDLRSDRSYLLDITLPPSGGGDGGSESGAGRLLAVAALDAPLAEQLERLNEDELLEVLEVELGPNPIGHPLVARLRLLKPEDEVVSDWRESQQYDGEIEALPLPLSSPAATREGASGAGGGGGGEGEDEEDAYAPLREKDAELDEEGVVQQLVGIPTAAAADPFSATAAAPLPQPPRTVRFMSRGIASAPPGGGNPARGSGGAGAGPGRQLLCELFAAEAVGERDEEEGGEADAPEAPASMVFLAAWMLDLSEAFRGVKPTSVSRLPMPLSSGTDEGGAATGGKKSVAGSGAGDVTAAAEEAERNYKVRKAERTVTLKRSEDGPEAAGLPLGTTLPTEMRITLRLWAAPEAARRLADEATISAARLRGLSAWLAQLRLVAVEEALCDSARRALRQRRFDAQNLKTSSGGGGGVWGSVGGDGGKSVAQLRRPCELTAQQSGRALPDVEALGFRTVAAGGSGSEWKLATSRSWPSLFVDEENEGPSTLPPPPPHRLREERVSQAAAALLAALAAAAAGSPTSAAPAAAAVGKPGAGLGGSRRSLPPPPPWRRAPPRRPRTVDTARRHARPEVPTRPTTPVVFTEAEVARRVGRRVAEAEERLRHRMDKDRAAMLDRVDALTAALSAAAEERRRATRDLDERAEAIRKCGVEIMELRRRVKALAADKDALQGELASASAERDALLGGGPDGGEEDLAMLGREELESRYSRLMSLYRAERDRAGDQGRRLQGLHEELTAAREAARGHEELERAHLAQAEKMVELQEKLARAGKYVETVQQQEQVIERLEAMLERAMGEAREGRKAKAEREGLMAEAERLRREVASLKAELAAARESAPAAAAATPAGPDPEVEKLRGKVAQLEAAKAAAEAGGPAQDRVKELEAEKADLEQRLKDAESKKPPRPEGGNSAEKEKLMLLMRAEKQALRQGDFGAQDEALRSRRRRGGRRRRRRLSSRGSFSCRVAVCHASSPSCGSNCIFQQNFWVLCSSQLWLRWARRGEAGNRSVTDSGAGHGPTGKGATLRLRDGGSAGTQGGGRSGSQGVGRRGGRRGGTTF